MKFVDFCLGFLALFLIVVVKWFRPGDEPGPDNGLPQFVEDVSRSLQTAAKESTHWQV